MPKLELNGFSRLEKSILAKTFHANCEKLGLLNSDFKVEVNKEHIGRVGLHGRVCRPAEDHYLVELNSNGFNLFDATSALGHETIHMKQYVDGRLKDDHRGCYWNDEFFHPIVTKLFYNDLPWEQEAWAMQGELHKHAFNSLSPEHQSHVDITKSNGLSRLWNE